MGKKKKSNFELDASEQMQLEKDFEKYFNYNTPVEPVNEQVQPKKVYSYFPNVDKSKEVQEATIHSGLDDEPKEMTESEMLCSIMGLSSAHTDEEMSSIFNPEWDKKKKHKATSINSIIKKGKKKSGWKHQLTDILLEKEISELDNSIRDITTTVSCGDPITINSGEDRFDNAETAVSGYLSVEFEKEDFSTSRIIFDEYENSLYVFNEYMSQENIKPDITLSMDHIIPSRINFETLDQVLLEDIVQDTVTLVTLLRKPDFVLDYDGMNEFLSHFSYLDYDLFYIYKMSTCMVTDDNKSNESVRYLIYLYSPVIKDSDGNEITELYNTISEFSEKLPGFVTYLSQYLMNPLVSNINPWNNMNNHQLITLGNHDEEEDLSSLVNYVTDPEVDTLYSDNKLWTEDSSEEKLNIDNFKKCIRMDVQYISFFINKLQNKMNKLLSTESKNTTEDESTMGTQDTESVDNTFEDVDETDDLIIEKIITGENRGE